MTTSPSFPERIGWRDEPDAVFAPYDEHPRVFLAQLRRLFLMFCGSFGDPAQLAGEALITRKDHRAMSAWIGSLESAVRALILLIALYRDPKLPAPPKPPEELEDFDPREGLARRVARTTAAPAADGAHEAGDAENTQRVLTDPGPPESWHAPFLLTPSRPLSFRVTFDATDPDLDDKIAAWDAWRARPPRSDAPPPPLVPALPLARRLEALLRALNDPEAQADRLLALLLRAPRYFAVADPKTPLREGCPCGSLMARLRQVLKPVLRVVWPDSLWPPEPDYLPGPALPDTS